MQNNVVRLLGFFIPSIRQELMHVKQIKLTGSLTIQAYDDATEKLQETIDSNHFAKQLVYESRRD